MELPRYDISQSYDWNYAHAPEISPHEAPPVPGAWTYCGLPVAAPLAMAAGPLLNSKWCLYYANLGFEVVTYKTVRSGPRSCYPLPNLVPVDAPPLGGREANLPAAAEFGGSWAISFGMPSKSPDVWTADVAATRRALPPGKKLCVSVVGTMQAGWSLERLADDYAECAAQAVVSGADCVEFNLSCPNVSTCDGQLYQQPADAALVAVRVRSAVGDAPLVAKIGYFANPQAIPPFVEALAPHVTAIATTNCIAATIAGNHFEGQPRGIGGRAILDASVRQVEAIANYAAQQNLPLRVIGVGGIFTAADLRRYLDAGAESTQLATAAMREPDVALTIRQELQRETSFIT
jgi:dihydroorotate dehydrogenase